MTTPDPWAAIREALDEARRSTLRVVVNPVDADRMRTALEGMPLVELVESLGVTPGTAVTWRGDPLDQLPPLGSIRLDDVQP